MPIMRNSQRVRRAQGQPAFVDSTVWVRSGEGERAAFRIALPPAMDVAPGNCTLRSNFPALHCKARAH